MPRFYIVKFTEICFGYDVFPLQKVVNSINVTSLKSVNKQAERDLALHDLSNHKLYATSLFNLLFDLSIEAFKGTFSLWDFFFDPSRKVNPIYECLGMIVVFL